MKSWYAFFACLLLSFSIWLVMNLSRSTTALESVTVQAYSNLEGRASVALETVDITARCRASGFRLLALATSKDVVSVNLDANDLTAVSEDVYSIESSKLARYASDIFGPGVVAESFVESSVRFTFLPENFKKVCVTPVAYITYKPQYMALKEMTLVPDSVLVYGEPSRLEHIDRVWTSPISLRELKRDARGEVALVTPEGVRLSGTKVDYVLPVGRYVELQSTERIEARNVPAGTDFVILPERVKVVWRCTYPLRTNPSENALFYVDYHEFEHSLTGNCIIHSETPDGVISFTSDPEVCFCMEQSDNR